jgi:hypothetical protein
MTFPVDTSSFRSPEYTSLRNWSKPQAIALSRPGECRLRQHADMLPSSPLQDTLLSPR